MKRRYLTAGISLTLALSSMALGQDSSELSFSTLFPTINCDEGATFFCLDRYTFTNYDGEYVGHDEPSLIFYSKTQGSGNQSIYNLILPKDPPVAPQQNGSGGTFNFQLHPAFWFGMAICDTQSFPNPDPNGICVPDSDTNIANNTNPRAPDYAGKHAGTAFLELQFYPPGWIDSPQLLSPNKYFVALNIDSFSLKASTGQNNNSDCLKKVGQEPVNFAVLTNNGVPLFPANPLGAAFGTSKVDLRNVLLMSPGDQLRVTIKDTPAGVMALVEDLTTGQSGFMVGSPASGFGQVNFVPSASACSVTPYAFHPMYASSSPSTRVPWAAHSYNIAFADEIGHFEYCNAFNTNANDPNFLRCTSPGVQDQKLDSDDRSCANPAFFGFPVPPFQNITGCTVSELDFDGSAYGFNWAGTNSPSIDALKHPQPIQFTSPVFLGPLGKLLNYDSVAFETDIPAFEFTCNVSTGLGCLNPPLGAKFYPIFSTTIDDYHKCWWQLGGPDIPNTANNFGGSSTTEYGDLLTQVFATPLGPVFEQLDFQQSLGVNPCQVYPIP